MKIFITGGSGLLGQFLNVALGKQHCILTQFFSNSENCKDFNSVHLSLTDHISLKKIFDEFKPEVVIHCASISNAEKVDMVLPSFAYDVNVNATKRIAELCSDHDAKLIYFSTDLVYAGYRGSILNEDAKLNPISFYAETKLMGEIKIQETFNNYIILRTALLYGFGLNQSLNHFQFAFKDLKNGKPVKLFTDQFRTPLEVSDSARMISDLLQSNISCEVLNFGGKDRLSRFQLLELVCEEAGFDKNLLIATTMDEVGLSYKVADVSMNTDKLKSFGVETINAREAIKRILSQQL